MIDSDGYTEKYNNASGLVIPIDNVIVGDIDIKVGTVSQGITSWTFCKSISLDFYREDQENTSWGNLTNAELKESDTVYTNVINTDNITEYSDIDLKVCSDSNKGISFSAVAVKNNNEYQFLKNIKKTNNNESGLCEHHLLNAYYQQYRAPRKSINLTIDEIPELNNCVYDPNFPDNRFIINSMNINYVDNTTELNIIEKI